MTKNAGDSAPKAVPGWYPTPSGGQRYWDGNTWLDIPEPQQEGMSPKPENPANRKMIIIGISVVVALIAIFLINSNVQQENARQEQIRIEASQQTKAEADQAAEEAKEKAAVEAEKTRRQGLIEELEKYLNETVVPDHIQKRLISGTPFGVNCDPVAGGSLSDTSEETTALQCFAQLVENGDGSYRGSFYDVTYNWTTGYYTWDLRV